MKPVTIDQLNMKDHVRWAKDQSDYDAFFVNESHLVAQHPEILGLSAIYASKFEELFELQKKNVPWAFFGFPQNFYLFSKRFFSYRLFPSMDWDGLDEQEDKKEDPAEDSENIIQQIINTPKPSEQTLSLFEKDKTAILNLLEAVKGIDRMLRQITARKLQYQKG